MTTRFSAFTLAFTLAVLLAVASAHGNKMADRKLLVPHGKFAYASSYTDDSPMQQENLLALRTLIESLSPLQFPFLVFVTRTSWKSQLALTDQGASVVQVPELGVGFDDTIQFNKLHAWNYTEYERIIYFEIGSVVVHPHELNELFLCGEFCAIYRSTPCALSKELFVLKPDRATYMDLLYALESKFSPQNVSRAFSPDQQFLSNFFSAAAEAPMFNAAKGPSTEKFNRLPFQYSVPGFYFIEKKSWDLYRCGLLTHYIDPITTIYYGAPLPSLMMPWYWWSTWLEPGWWFLSARKRLGEPELPVVVISRLLLCLLLPIFAGNRVVSALIRWGGKPNSFPEPTAKILNYLGAILFSGLLALICSFLSINMTLLSFPATVPPVPGWILFIAFYHSYLLLLGRLVAGFVLALRGAAYGHAFNFSDMKPSIIMWTIFACQPLIDESVSRYVKWNIVSKVLTNTPVVFFLLGTQFFMFFNLVRNAAKTPAIPA